MAMSTLQNGNLPANLNNLPGMPPPPGEIPNLYNPYSRGGTYTAVGTTIIVAMALFVINRQYTKHFIVREWNWDDCKSSKISLYWEVQDVNIGASDMRARLCKSWALSNSSMETC